MDGAADDRYRAMGTARAASAAAAVFKPLVYWAGNYYVCARFKDGHEHEYPTDGRRINGVGFITPAAAYRKHLDPEQSILDAMKYSEVARAAVEEFLRRE
jgi:hypothetical protein